VGSLLRLHPDDRPTAQQALQHPFVADLPGSPTPDPAAAAAAAVAAAAAAAASPVPGAAAAPAPACSDS